MVEYPHAELGGIVTEEATTHHAFNVAGDAVADVLAEHEGSHVLIEARLTGDPDGRYHLAAMPGPDVEDMDVVTNLMLVLAHTLLQNAASRLGGAAKFHAEQANDEILRAVEAQR